MEITFLARDGRLKGRANIGSIGRAELPKALIVVQGDQALVFNQIENSRAYYMEAYSLMIGASEVRWKNGPPVFTGGLA